MIGAAFAQRLRHKQGAEVPSPFPFRERMSMNTRQTAEIMAAHLQPEEGKRQIAGLAPSDDVEPTRERVQKESGKFNDRRPSALSQPAGIRTPWGWQEEGTDVTFQMAELSTWRPARGARRLGRWQYPLATFPHHLQSAIYLSWPHW